MSEPDDLATLVRAATPLLVIETVDEQRVRQLREIAQRRKSAAHTTVLVGAKIELPETIFPASSRPSPKPSPVGRGLQGSWQLVSTVPCAANWLPLHLRGEGWGEGSL